MNIKNKKIILDVDTGIDDAMAIAVTCLENKAQIIGITTCGGNLEVKQVSRNTLAILDLLQKNIPVFEGSSKPITKKSFIYAKYYHGNNGLCNISIRKKSKLKKIKAEDFIIQSALNYQNDLILICTAPLTNLAKAIKKRPEISRLLKNVFIMGGAVNVPGNESEYVETNFFQDPHAAQIVFKNLKKIKIIPLDVTNKCIITKRINRQLKNKNIISNFFYNAIINWYNFFGDKKNRYFELYDPLAVSAIFTNYLKFKKIKLDIDIKKYPGRIIKGSFCAEYAYSVDHVGFVKYLISLLTKH